MIQQKHEELDLLKESPTRQAAPVVQDQSAEAPVLPEVVLPEEEEDSSVLSASSDAVEPNRTPWKPKGSVKSLKADRPTPPARWASFNRSPLRDAKNVMSMLESPPKKTQSADKKKEDASNKSQSTLSSSSSLPLKTNSSKILEDKKTTQKETAMVKPRIVAKVSPLQMKSETDQNSVVKKLDFSSQSSQQKKKIPPPTPPKPPKSVAMFINSFTDSSQQRLSPKIEESIVKDLETKVEDFDKKITKKDFSDSKNSSSTIPLSPEKPKILPKPNIKSKPSLTRKSSKEVDEVYSKTANARAAFFGISPKQKEQKVKGENITKKDQSNKIVNEGLQTPKVLVSNSNIAEENSATESLENKKSQVVDTCIDKKDQNTNTTKKEKVVSESVVNNKSFPQNKLDNDKKQQLKDLANEKN